MLKLKLKQSGRPLLITRLHGRFGSTKHKRFISDSVGRKMDKFGQLEKCKCSSTNSVIFKMSKAAIKVVRSHRFQRGDLYWQKFLAICTAIYANTFPLGKRKSRWIVAFQRGFHQFRMQFAGRSSSSSMLVPTKEDDPHKALFHQQQRAKNTFPLVKCKAPWFERNEESHLIHIRTRQISNYKISFILFDSFSIAV